MRGVLYMELRFELMTSSFDFMLNYYLYILKALNDNKERMILII